LKVILHIISYNLISLVFDIIKNIIDPEHPLTLEDLNIVSPQQIFVDSSKKRIQIFFTPTIPNCGMSTLIGLMIKVKLLSCVNPLYKVNNPIYY